MLQNTIRQYAVFHHIECFFKEVISCVEIFPCTCYCSRCYSNIQVLPMQNEETTTLWHITRAVTNGHEYTWQMLTQKLLLVTDIDLKLPVLAYLFTKQHIFRLFQIQSICRWQNKCNWKTEILSGIGRKHCGKRRKCWLPAFSSFPAMFSKGFFHGVVKSRDCVVKY